MKTVFCALMLAGAFLISPLAHAGDDAPAGDAKPAKSKHAKKAKGADADKTGGSPAPAKDPPKTDKGGW